MRKKPRQQKICAYCGKVFLAKRKDAVYCSTNCCQMSYYERNRETVLRKNRQRRLNGIIQKIQVNLIVFLILLLLQNYRTELCGLFILI